MRSHSHWTSQTNATSRPQKQSQEKVCRRGWPRPLFPPKGGILIQYYSVSTVLQRYYSITALLQYYSVITVLQRYYSITALVQYYSVSTVLQR